jgi:hypothetical protein
MGMTREGGGRGREPGAQPTNRPTDRPANLTHLSLKARGATAMATLTFRLERIWSGETCL